MCRFVYKTQPKMVHVFLASLEQTMTALPHNSASSNFSKLHGIKHMYLSRE
jgi:hypothetical protein